jgi:hypothetical protein
MNRLRRCLLACAPLLTLAACGGGDDLQDRLDVADPSVRFIHASPAAPNVSLFRDTQALADATNVGYGFGSDYVDIAMGAATWSVKTSPGGASIGSVPIDPVRGDRYTFVAMTGANSDASVALIVDPYNKSLTSQDTRVRVLNASFNAANIDLYLTPVGTSIAAAAPTIAATAYTKAGPASGNDSIDIPGGSYTLTITPAGSKSVLFSGPLAFGNNQDELLITVPDGVTPGAIKVLEKREGVAGANELPSS